MGSKETPYFIEIRGCINCESSKAMKERRGYDYGFDHQILAGCLIRDCLSYGHTIANPYIDPAEFVRLAKEMNSPEAKKRVEEIFKVLGKTYGDYYQAVGISLAELLASLDESAV